MDLILITLIAAGFMIGIIAAFFGIGGGVLFVPTLILLFDLEPKMAVGTSLLAILITSISSCIAYAKRRKIIFKLGLLLELASVPGALLGAYVVNIIPGYTIRWAFSIFLIIVALNITREKDIKAKGDYNDLGRYTKKHLVLAMLFAFIAGFLSATLGIGGGVLKVPIMIIVLSLPIHYAVATSSFMITITASAGLIRHWGYGHVEPIYGLMLGLGAIGGSQIGAYLSLKTKPRKLKILFAVLLIIVSIRLLL